MTVGLAMRLEGNFRVRCVKVFFDASAWYIMRSGLVLSSQLQKLASVRPAAGVGQALPERLQFVHLVQRCSY